VLDVLGDDHVMFETDYPHPTCLYPDPRARLAELEPRIGADSLRKVLCDNAAELYRVEL
jgi:predicted TIM-barrel fold metal-dependent hydrolase